MLFKFPIPKLNLDLVHLRPLAHYQADAIFKAVDRNRDHLKPWLPWVDDTHGVSDTRDWIKTVLKKTGKGIHYSFSIWQNDHCIGMMSFNNICKKTYQGEIGYWLDKDYTGHGIITVAVSKLVTFGFEILDLNKITIRASHKNRPSIAVAKQLGFHTDARLRKNDLLDGEYHDDLVFSILSHEWENNSRLDRPDHPA